MNTQFVVFAAITAAIAVFTYLQCRKAPRSGDDNAEYFLAGRTLSWYFIAGSITLTNLSTDQLVGMNGNQMLLLAWWELAAVVGLLVLAFVFVPIYYHYDCATTTELLEKRYGRQSLRSLVSILFLMGNVFLYLPIMLYTGS
ncbi:MAG: SSS family solute:Na+ symporter, partial [Glaciecola sp.]